MNSWNSSDLSNLGQANTGGLHVPVLASSLIWRLKFGSFSGLNLNDRGTVNGVDYGFWNYYKRLADFNVAGTAEDWTEASPLS